MSNKLFDEVDTEENEYEGETGYEEGPTHLEQIRQILDESKIDVDEEDCDKEFTTYLVIDGVLLGFDRDDKLIAIKKV